MNGVQAIYLKELITYFRSPIAYFVVSVFLLGTGYFFVYNIFLTGVGTMDQTFQKHRFWTKSVITEKPSAYWYRPGHATFIQDLTGVAERGYSGAFTIEATLRRAGDIVLTTRIVVSRDGRVLTLTFF